MSTADSVISSYREALLEHLFSGEVMRCVWLSGLRRLEIMKPQVDDGGYDLVLEAADVVRHIQLKGTFRGSKVQRFSVNAALATKPSGCAIVLLFDPQTLELGPFLWFGAEPRQPLPSLAEFRVGKHTKANSKGVKLPRQAIRVIPRSRFTRVASMSELAVRLFGARAERLGPAA